MDRKYKVKQSQEITKEVYLHFVRYCKKYGYSPSYDEIAQELNISRHTVQNHVLDLMESGLLATDHPGTSRAIRVTGYQMIKTKEKTI